MLFTLHVFGLFYKPVGDLSSYYQEGIGRLRTAWEKQLRVAVMCTELKPQECHRGKLIGASLIEQQIDVAHIDEEGNIKTQEDINQLLGGNQPTLFGEPCPIREWVSRAKDIP